MNGKPGDHPLTDVLSYHAQVFSPEVDQLIVELEQFGVWDSRLVSFLMLGFHHEVERLRQRGEEATLLHNFAWTLRAELQLHREPDAPHTSG
jgi:hypothetical protein